MVATHNGASVRSAVEAMEKLGIAPECPSVQFAQVMGASNRTPVVAITVLVLT